MNTITVTESQVFVLLMITLIIYGGIGVVIGGLFGGMKGLAKSIVFTFFCIKERKSWVVIGEAESIEERCALCVVGAERVGKSRLCNDYCGDDLKYFTVVRPESEEILNECGRG